MPINHKQYCQCGVCKAIRGERKGLSLIETGHKIDCCCSFCKRSRNEINYFTGKHHSKISKDRISKTKKKNKVPHKNNCSCVICKLKTRKIKSSMVLHKIDCNCYGCKMARRELRKEKHWNWKGGISRLSNIVRSLKESGEWREEIFRRDEYTCRICGNHGYVGNGKSVYLEAHHIKPFRIILKEFLATYKLSLNNILNYKEFWDLSNGITLCTKCHKTQGK